MGCLYYGLWDAGLLIHHFLCLLGFGSALWFNYGGIDSVGGLFVAEISNLPMHLRVILRNYGLRFTRSYEYCENIYLSKNSNNLSYLHRLQRTLLPFLLAVPQSEGREQPSDC